MAWVRSHLLPICYLVNQKLLKPIFMPVDFTKVIEPLRHGLIVSCQAPANSPLHEPSVIAAIATASINQGAVAIRIDTPAHIQAVKQRCNAPIIGLWKQIISGYDVYITPQFHHAEAVSQAGADIIAIDATTRDRPQGETITSLITQIHNLGKPVMADVDTIDNAIAALKAGADLSIQSIHKTLGALTQASMLHVQGDRINRDRLTKSLELVQSSSPSSLLLASLDAARQQMAVNGKQLMSRTLQLAESARNQISQIPGLSVLELTIATPGFVALDKTRLTVNVSGLGLTGFAADEILVDYGVIAELPSLQNLTFIISLGNTDADIEQLVQAMKIATKHKQILAIERAISPFNHESKLALTPRQAFDAIVETLPVEQTCDHICAELVCPYPPGIPVLIPGEIVTKGAIAYLQKIQSLGGYINGCADSSLKTLKVILDKGQQVFVN